MEASWKPPSDRLHLIDGLWQSDTLSRVSYPDHGNDICYQIEDGSYWFNHRNNCIIEIMRQFPPAGTFYDIGGGNGFVAAGLQGAGFETVLLEPGSGASNAIKRGLKNVIQSTLGDAGFAAESLGAAGAFDVVEHIEDDLDFLKKIRELLPSGGRFYCTVPAHQTLWSQEDVAAGHYRRYSASSLGNILQKAGMEIEFVTLMFSWLVAPVFLFRSLPHRMSSHQGTSKAGLQQLREDHGLPSLISSMVERVHEWELGHIQRRMPIGLGSSLLCVGRVP